MIDPSQVLATELSLPPHAVRAVLDLLGEGGTVPFIARYRKERTGGLDEVQIRAIQVRSEYLAELEKRKAAVLASIEEQGKLDPDLKARIERARTKTEVEDLYLPFKPKRHTRASIARERGLEPLADRIAGLGPADRPLTEIAAAFVDPSKEVHAPEQALAGARDILAERIAEDAANRAAARKRTLAEGRLVCKVTEEKAGEKSKFSHYYDHKEPLKGIPSHRYLAIRRGEKEDYLRVAVEAPAGRIVERIEAALLRDAAGSPFAAELKKAIADAYARLIAPSIESEVREELKERADDEAIDVFAINLRNLLLASPLGAKTVIGLDPGFRTGVKVAVIDGTGKVLEHVAIFPFAREEKGKETKGEARRREKKEKREGKAERGAAETAAGTGVATEAESGAGAGAGAEAEAVAESVAVSESVTVSESATESVSDSETGSGSDAATDAFAVSDGRAKEAAERRAAKVTEAKVILAALVQKHEVAAIAIGNGTAGRETETFVDDFLREWVDASGRKVLKVMVNESGASVYSASELAREEFPNLDVTVRGAISIGRRLQDPLAELVKIDPRSIGVGQYQHDVHQGRLKRTLSDVVESCVNLVGVDVNTASAPLLSYVAGIGPSLSRKIVKHREARGRFASREAIKEVPGFGAKAFEQAAGFLRVPGAENPLDNSAVHPESYAVVERMAADLGVTPRQLVGKPELVEKIDWRAYATAATATPGGEAEPAPGAPSSPGGTEPAGETAPVGASAASDVSLGELSLRDILEELKKPGRDPRAEFTGVHFRSDVRSVRDLAVGMMLEGVVTNVTAFGAFVDVGVHQDGLVHVSELSHLYVRDPVEAVRVGERVKVKVLAVEPDRRRISLSIKAATPAPPEPARARPPRRDGERAGDSGAAARGPDGRRSGVGARSGAVGRPDAGGGPTAGGRPEGGRGPRRDRGRGGPRPGGPRSGESGASADAGASRGASSDAGAPARGPHVGGPGRPDRDRRGPHPGGESKGPRPDRRPAPRKVGTHGKTAAPVDNRGIMGPERGPRERLPKQKGPDTSLGALFGDLLNKLNK